MIFIALVVGAQSSFMLARKGEGPVVMGKAGRAFTLQNQRWLEKKSEEACVYFLEAFKLIKLQLVHD